MTLRLRKGENDEPYNKVILAGNLTRSPELRYTPSGVAVAAFDMATSHVRIGEQGERKEETEFHHIVAFGKLAETAAEDLAAAREHPGIEHHPRQ